VLQIEKTPTKRVLMHNQNLTKRPHRINTARKLFSLLRCSLSELPAANGDVDLTVRLHIEKFV